MDLQSQFATSGNEAMFERQSLLKEAEAQLAGWLDEDGPFLTDLRVKSGGRQSQFAPVPWLRIYSPVHSPRTTQGFYLVYLFAADGEVLYLSLNQGTSEFRSGKWRPILDHMRIESMSAQARDRLRAWGSALPTGIDARIELRPETQNVGPESVGRARNYEFGNVYAMAYPRLEIPSESLLRADLLSFVPLLEEIYRDPLDPGDGEVPIRSRSGGGRRRLSDAAIRRACEYRAMDVVEDHYLSQGWDVERVHLQYLGYDLECQKDGAELHVEVKGSTVDASQVELTANEVSHARQYEGAVLAVVDRIVMESDADNNPVGVGGELRLFEPWALVDDSLAPTRFIYQLS